MNKTRKDARFLKQLKTTHFIKNNKLNNIMSFWQKQTSHINHLRGKNLYFTHWTCT